MQNPTHGGQLGPATKKAWPRVCKLKSIWRAKSNRMMSWMTCVAAWEYFPKRYSRVPFDLIAFGNVFHPTQQLNCQNVRRMKHSEGSCLNHTNRFCFSRLIHNRRLYIVRTHALSYQCPAGFMELRQAQGYMLMALQEVLYVWTWVQWVRAEQIVGAD